MSMRAARWLLILFAVLAGLATVPTAASAAAISEFSAGLNPGDHPRHIVPGPDGNLWFTLSSSNGAIGRATTGGTITRFSAGLNAGSHPWDITVGPDGNLWFTDNRFPEGPAAIGRISTTGTITEFSSGLNQDSEASAVEEPVEIVAGPDGNLWFTDYGFFGGTPAIGRIMPSGAITLYELPEGSSPSAIAVGPDGNLWFTNSESVGKITPSGTVTEYPTPEREPLDITVGPDGNLWFTAASFGEGVPAAIDRITTAGVLTEYSLGLNPGSEPFKIVTGPDGNLWFTDLGGGAPGPTTPAIGRVTPTGTITEFATEGESRPETIVAGPDGNIWATDEFGRLYRVTPSGTIATFRTGLDGGEPRDLVVGPGESNLWLTDGGIFTPSGEIGEVSPVGPNGVSPLPTLSIHSIGTGSGSVTSSPAGISCPGNCSTPFPAGTAVMLTPTPNPGSAFTGWSNATCKGTGACEVTIDGDVDLTAGFGTSVPGGGEVPPGGHETVPPKSTHKPHHCRKGFRKKRAHGKVRCVRVRGRRRSVRSVPRAMHLGTTLAPEAVLRQLHNVVHRYSVDTLATHRHGDNVCDLRGLIKGIPPYPRCAHLFATLTSAFLTPSSGGFRTKCDNPEAVTYHFYGIYTRGQRYHTCGPGPIPGGLGNPEQMTKEGEFQGKLNYRGQAIEQSVGLDTQLTTVRISGTPAEVTAWYRCPPAGRPAPAGAFVPADSVRKIVVHKHRSATTVGCAEQSP